MWQLILPARLHKYAKLHAFSFHFSVSQEASLVQEVAYMSQGLAAKEGEPISIAIINIKNISQRHM